MQDGRGGHTQVSELTAPNPGCTAPKPGCASLFPYSNTKLHKFWVAFVSWLSPFLYSHDIILLSTIYLFKNKTSPILGRVRIVSDSLPIYPQYYFVVNYLPIYPFPTNSVMWLNRNIVLKNS